MEIERKFLVKKLPAQLDAYPYREIEQAYLCTEPVVRIRQKDQDFILTYKSSGLMVREEVELPLTESAYHHLLKKADGIVITKRRYLIPYRNEYEWTIELDLFKGSLEGLVLAEVEFPSEEIAKAFEPPEWFGREVTYDPHYHNSNLSQHGLSAN